jgi:hypothetical protein
MASSRTILRSRASVLRSGVVGGSGPRGGTGEVSWADIQGDPRDNSALSSELDGIAAGSGGVVNASGIAGLTGGGATNLDGIVTAALAVTTGTSYFLSFDGGQVWQLLAGTDAENAGAGIVRPDDYDAGTNARVWVRIL